MPDIKRKNARTTSLEIVDIAELKQSGLVNADKKVTDLHGIKIKFTYPLSQPCVRDFYQEKVWTLFDFVKAVERGYRDIYREEEDAVGNPGHIKGMANRNTSHGPHGIWGHDIEDLCLEGYSIEGDTFHLQIGS